MSCIIYRTTNYALIICVWCLLTHWHEQSFDRLINQPAILKYVIFVTTIPISPFRLGGVDSFRFDDAAEVIMHWIPVRGDLQNTWMSVTWRICGGGTSAWKRVLDTLFWWKYYELNLLNRSRNTVLQPTWCFIGLRAIEYNVWLRVHGEVSLCEVGTHISMCRLFARRRLHKELYMYNVCHGAFWDSSFRSCLLSISLPMLRSSAKRFETNNSPFRRFYKFNYLTKWYIEWRKRHRQLPISHFNKFRQYLIKIADSWRRWVSHGRNLQAAHATSNPYGEEEVWFPNASTAKGVYSPPDHGYLK